jgi:hypothetical protein
VLATDRGQGRGASDRRRSGGERQHVRWEQPRRVRDLRPVGRARLRALRSDDGQRDRRGLYSRRLDGNAGVDVGPGAFCVISVDESVGVPGQIERRIERSAWDGSGGDHPLQSEIGLPSRLRRNWLRHGRRGSRRGTQGRHALRHRRKQRTGAGRSLVDLLLRAAGRSGSCQRRGDTGAGRDRGRRVRRVRRRRVRGAGLTRGLRSCCTRC